jgi:hypothetical protein
MISTGEAETLGQRRNGLLQPQSSPPPISHRFSQATARPYQVDDAPVETW